MDLWNPPPEFDEDGHAPPMRSEQLVSYSYSFSLRGKVSSTSGIEQLEGAESPFLKGMQDYIREHAGFWEAMKEQASREGRELVVVEDVEWSWWERQPQLRQLPPGATSKISRKITNAITKVGTEETGFKVGLSSPAPTAELAWKEATSTTYLDQQEGTEELTLVNDRKDTYRRFAIWYEIHCRRQGETELDRKGSLIGIKYLPEERKILDGGATVTFIDVPAGKKLT